jgi:hypothetical protein
MRPEVTPPTATAADTAAVKEQAKHGGASHALRIEFAIRRLSVLKREFSDLDELYPVWEAVDAL